MMKGSRTTVLTFAEKCKTILASNWQGNLNTVKADAKGSKEEIYSSKVKYFVKKGRPYGCGRSGMSPCTEAWLVMVSMGFKRQVNTVIDERGSLAVTSPIPGSLASLLQSLKKPPNRVALIGEVVPLGDKKVKTAAESLREAIISEGEAIKKFSYSGENLQELLDEDQQYMSYKFDISSITYIEGKGSSHEVDLKDMEESKADPLSLFSASLIDGINQSEARRRALMILCATYLNKNVKDVVVVSVDRKGVDLQGCGTHDGCRVS
ncbi:uncharacterized protein LOC112523938 [Cynara cardunculus var. scolymus]|uniref:uncharacterized protein LOC112523938 n=1 Tax=Cynara cardunculus var. scolymus TaxID=59895 RepID=UPI000D626D5C|nr:uncharacterized protein LOC112523938 [Cynara cardunculus var. scolymus]